MDLMNGYFDKLCESEIIIKNTLNNTERNFNEKVAELNDSFNQIGNLLKRGMVNKTGVCDVLQEMSVGF